MKQENTEKVASVAQTIMKLCEDGNQTALSIIDDASDELVLSVKSISEQVTEPFSLLLSGGLLQTETPLRKLFIKKVSTIKKINCISVLNCEAAYVSAAIALLNNGREDSAERLMKSIKEIEIL